MWDLLLERWSSGSLRNWKRAKLASDEEEVEILIDRIPCRWCKDLCSRTNEFLGTNIKLVFIHRVQPVADRCKCGGCICDLPKPQVAVPMLGNLGMEDPGESSRPIQQSTRKHPKQKPAVTPSKMSATATKLKQITAAASLPTPGDTPRTPQKSVVKSATPSSKKYQQAIFIDSLEFSESEEEEWTRVDSPTPAKLPSGRKMKPMKSSKTKESNSVSLNSAIASSLIRKPVPKLATPSKAQHAFVESDNDSDMSEWKPRSSSATKRKKSSVMSEKPSPKRQRIEPQKFSSTSYEHHQMSQNSPSSIFAQYRFAHEKTSSTAKPSSSKMTSIPSKMTPSTKITPTPTKTTSAKTTPVKKTSSAHIMPKMSSLTRNDSSKMSPAKTPKRKDRPPKKSKTSSASASMQEDELSFGYGM